MASQRKQSKEPGENNLGAMFKSLGGFLGLLSELAEKGQELSKTGEIGEFDKDGKETKAVYGFSMRFGGDKAGRPSVQPFGNVKVGKRGGAVVEEAREPMVDVFDEEDHVGVVAEMPGVELKDVRYVVEGDVLELSAMRGDRKYRKEVLLPGAVDMSTAKISCHNGVFELRLPKVKG